MLKRKKIIQALLGAAAIALPLYLSGNLTPSALLTIVSQQAAQLSSGSPTASGRAPSASSHATPSPGVTSEVSRAFRDERSGVMVETVGTIEKTLPDDNKGSRHQRFLVDVDDGPTILIAHNIDLAPRVPLHQGDRVEIRGQYEFNSQGGVVHWTHHDPKGRRPGGWIRHAGALYQ